MQSIGQFASCFEPFSQKDRLFVYLVGIIIALVIFTLLHTLFYKNLKKAHSENRIMLQLFAVSAVSTIVFAVIAFMLASNEIKGKECGAIAVENELSNSLLTFGIIFLTSSGITTFLQPAGSVIAKNSNSAMTSFLGVSRLQKLVIILVVVAAVLAALLLWNQSISLNN